MQVLGTETADVPEFSKLNKIIVIAIVLGWTIYWIKSLIQMPISEICGIFSICTELPAVSQSSTWNYSISSSMLNFARFAVRLMVQKNNGSESLLACVHLVRHKTVLFRTSKSSSIVVRIGQSRRLTDNDEKVRNLQTPIASLMTFPAISRINDWIALRVTIIPGTPVN